MPNLESQLKIMDLLFAKKKKKKERKKKRYPVMPPPTLLHVPVYPLHCSRISYQVIMQNPSVRETNLGLEIVDVHVHVQITMLHC